MQRSSDGLKTKLAKYAKNVPTDNSVVIPIDIDHMNQIPTEHVNIVGIIYEEYDNDRGVKMAAKD